ncbi:MAG: nuclear transport factor 2 family protein [Egibacteraceae bacterium]
MTDAPSTAHANATRPQWSVKSYEAFWRHPDPNRVPLVLTEDVVGDWPGREELVRGPTDYARCVARLVEALPDVHLSVVEHAQSGEFVFIRWIMHATGARGPFELTGIDRVRVRDGRVAENVIVFDTAAFRARSGLPVPWV